MQQILGATLKNVVVFEEAQIPFLGKGLVLITGRNLDCLESNDQTNMVGKSLSLSCLPNVVYYAAPLSVKKNSKKEMLGEKDSVICLYLKNEQGTFKLEQTPKETRIYEKTGDGYVDQEYRTDKLQREAISKLFPLSMQEFYSYVYLQNQRPLEFQTGTPTSRLKFITQAFPQLSVYDRLHKYFSTQLSKVKQDEGKFDVLTTKYKDTITRIKKLKLPEDAEQKVESYNKKLEELSELLDRVIEEETKLKGLIKASERYASMTKELDLLMEALTPLKRKALRKTLKALKEDLKTLSKQQRYEDAVKDRESTIKNIKKKLAKIRQPDISKEDATSKGKKLRSEINKMEAELDAAEEAKEAYDDAVSEYNTLDHWLKEHVKVAKKFSHMSVSDVDERVGLLKSNLALEDLIHDHKDGQCPTCLQDIDVQNIKRLVKSAKVELAELKTARKVAEAKAELEAIKIPEKVSEKKLKKIRASVDKKEKEISKLEAAYKAHTKIASLQESLDDVPEIKKPKLKFNSKLRSEKELDQKIEQIEEALELIAKIDSIKEDYPNVGSKVPSADKLTKKKEELRSKQKKLNDKFQKLSNAVSNRELLVSQYKELKAEIAEIKPFIEKRKTFESLVAVYGNKGLKLEATRSILKLVEDKMNEYSHLIFTEAVSFKLGTTKQGVTCSIIRAKQKADVSVLSGAETNCFRLLFMIAMLSLVPENRRTNFVVLDEADSAMSEASREKYITQFIPELRKVVDKVFVITPKPTNLYEDAETWVVEKQGGKSRILKNGKPVKLRSS